LKHLETSQATYIGQIRLEKNASVWVQLQAHGAQNCGLQERLCTSSHWLMGG
jgi:hypothetical protein